MLNDPGHKATIIADEPELQVYVPEKELSII